MKDKLVSSSIRRHGAFVVYVVFASVLAAGCSDQSTLTSVPAAGESSPTTWKISDGVEYPTGRLLARSEDGVMLPDGSLIVADQRYGLVEINTAGQVRAFGQFEDTNYSHNPPATEGGPNGVHFTYDKTGVLTADVFSGAIYKTSIAEERTVVVYSHEYGVNTAKEDSTGAIWFTQSTRNFGEERLFEAIAKPIPDGILYRLQPGASDINETTLTMVVDELNFANGFYIDEQRKKLYLSETLANRVLVFDLDISAGTLSNRAVLATIPSPDNMDLNHDGTLWVASPLSNQIHRIDLDTGTVDVVFDAQTKQGVIALTEGIRRVEIGNGIADLLGTETTGEMPGLLTGMILGGETDPFYVANLGAALIKISPIIE